MTNVRKEAQEVTLCLSPEGGGVRQQDRPNGSLGERTAQGRKTWDAPVKELSRIPLSPRLCFLRHSTEPHVSGGLQGREESARVLRLGPHDSLLLTPNDGRHVVSRESQGSQVLQDSRA